MGSAERRCRGAAPPAAAGRPWAASRGRSPGPGSSRCPASRSERTEPPRLQPGGNLARTAAAGGISRGCPRRPRRGAAAPYPYSPPESRGAPAVPLRRDTQKRPLPSSHGRLVTSASAARRAGRAQTPRGALFSLWMLGLRGSQILGRKQWGKGNKRPFIVICVRPGVSRLQGGSVIIKKQCLPFGRARQPQPTAQQARLPKVPRALLPGFLRSCADSKGRAGAN